jgi:hypothetical protein
MQAEGTRRKALADASPTEENAAQKVPATTHPASKLDLTE